RWIPEDADFFNTQKTLAGPAKPVDPNAQQLSLPNFPKSPEYEALVERLKSDS
ncbi:PTS mannitol transporter subunit IIBC, partial [Paenibacillus sp. 28ISP30-2]|nr:PTS mannitol transporter subunit IIBC [Paenibacillus sp. 28ISP30-2]